MVFGGGGEDMANKWWIIKSSQESVYSTKLSGMLEWRRSSCVCSALSTSRAPEFNLCTRRFSEGYRAGSTTWMDSPRVNAKSWATVCECPKAQTPSQITERLIYALHSLLETRFQGLSKPIRKNLVVLTAAFLHVMAAARSSNGRLSLGLLARALPTSGTPHAREKRLCRFLNNSQLDYQKVAGNLGKILLSDRKGLCPILFDQTKSGSAQALLAAVPYAGRALPLSCYTFEYPFTGKEAKSQNQLEHKFLLDTEESLQDIIKPVWIGDRYYSRSLLLEQSQNEGRLYIVRGRGGTIVTCQGRRLKLKQLKHKPKKAIRYKDVLYQSKRQVKVDVIVYHDPNYKETWYLLVPVSSRSFLHANLVVDLYRERMQIEQSFRDFKTHIGMRGLKLQVNISARTGRLLLSFSLAYVLCVLLGESSLGQKARTAFEIPRHTARNGTTRTLSALMLAMLMLSHPVWIYQSHIFLLNLILYAANGYSWLTYVTDLPPPFNTN